MKQGLLMIILIMIELKWLHGASHKKLPEPIDDKVSEKESRAHLHDDDSGTKPTRGGAGGSDSNGGLSEAESSKSQPDSASSTTKNEGLRWHRPPLFTTNPEYWSYSDSREPYYTTDVYYWYPYSPWYYPSGSSSSSSSSSSSNEYFPIPDYPRPDLFTTTPAWWPLPSNRPPLFPTYPTIPPLFPTNPSRPPLFPTGAKPPLGAQQGRQVDQLGEAEETPQFERKEKKHGGSYSDSSDYNNHQHGFTVARIEDKLGPIVALTYPDEDFVCSPVCSMMPLGKLALGASGKTAQELYNAIGVSGPDGVSAVFSNTIRQLKYLKGVKLDMASAIFVAPDIAIAPSYEVAITKVFASSMRNLRAKDPIGAANEINKWVSTQTNGKINNVIMSSQISRDTKMILVNAINFQGTWKYKFGRASPGTFYSRSGQAQIPMMHTKATVKHTFSEPLYSEVISLPYYGGDSSLVILLPKTDTDLPRVIERIKRNPAVISEVLQNAPVVKDLLVTIPKFKIQSSVNLETIYKKLKIKRMFLRKQKNFKAICNDNDLYVTAAVQKAIFDVTEEGTSGSSAAGGIIGSSRPKKSFLANRPFYFVVFVNGKQLFSGQFYGTDIF